MKISHEFNEYILQSGAFYEKLLSDVPNSRLITVATISDKLRVNGSLARAAIRDLESKGLIKKVSTHNAQLLYTHVEKQKEPETTAA